MSNPFDGWIVTEEAQELTGYTPDYLRRLARDEKVEAEKVGGNFWLFSKDSLIAWKREMEDLGTSKHSPKRKGLK
jgi:excisionase family DNA binding protein